MQNLFVFWGFISFRSMYIFQMCAIYYHLVSLQALSDARSICAFIWSVMVFNVLLSKLWLSNLINSSYVKNCLYFQMKDRYKNCESKRKNNKTVYWYSPLKCITVRHKNWKNMLTISSALNPFLGTLGWQNLTKI